MNPTAGGGRLLAQRAALEEAAQALGYRLEWWQTERPGHAQQLARQAAARGHALLLAYGGDGTYNEVAQGLLGSNTALGILPGGTTSVLVYELAIPRPAVKALPVLLQGSDRTMRVGRTSRGDLFLLMVSTGPDALVLKNLSPLCKRIGGKLGIAAQAMVELVRARLPRIKAQLGAGKSVEGGWAVVGKSRCYAGPFAATPGADVFAGNLELVMLRSASRRAVVPFALAIPTGRHIRRRDVLQHRTTRLTLAPAVQGDVVPYQVDGDYAGELPIEIWVDPDPLLVRLPPPLAGEMLTVKDQSFATP